MNNFKNGAIEKLDNSKSEPELLNDLNDYLEKEFSNTLASYSSDDEILIDFDGYTLEQFSIYSKDAITEIINTVFEGVVLKETIRPIIDELYWNYFKSLNFIGRETGLVFGGYGEKQRNHR